MQRLTRRLLLGSTLASGAVAGARAQTDRKTKLSAVWVGWTEPEVKPLMDAYLAAHADVELAYERIPFVEMMQTLEVRLNARTPLPDVFCTDGPLTGSYAVRGHLLDLTPVFGPEKARFTPAAWNQGTFRDKLYSAPFQSSSALLFANRKLLAAAGVEPPVADINHRWTWEQVAEAAVKTTDKAKGVFGFVFEQTDRPYQLLPLPQSRGAKVISDDGLSVGDLFGKPEFLSAIQFYADLFNKLGVSPQGVFDFSLAREMFATGRAALFVGGTWCVDQFRQNKDLDFAVGPFPYFAGGTPVTQTGSWHLGINPRGKNIDKSIEFVRFMVSEPTQETWFKLRPAPPVLNGVWQALAATFNTPAWTITRYELAHTAVPRPKTPGWREYEDLLRLAFRDIQGGAEVAPRMSRAAKDIDRELTKYRS